MEEIDLEQVLMAFWNRKFRVFLIIALFVVIGIIYTMYFVTPAYTSSTTLVLATAEGDTIKNSNTITTTDITLNSKLVSTYSELVKSNNVIRQVISNLRIDADEAVLKKNISVTAVSNTELIKITVTSDTPKKAALIANETAKVFMEKVKEIYNINNVHVVDEAEENDVPSNVNNKKDVITFAFIGIIVAVGYVIIANMFDTTIKTAEEVEKQFKIPVLCSIPLYNFDNEKGGGKKK